MSIWRFDIEENKNGRVFFSSLYPTTEEGAKALKKELDRDGLAYSYCKYDSIYSLVKDTPEMTDPHCTDAQRVDAILEILSAVGL